MNRLTGRCYTLIQAKEAMYVVEAPHPPVAELEAIPLVDPDILGAEPDSSDRYYELRRRAVEASEAGHLEQALRYCDEALRMAERLGDEELVDQAFCNRSEVAAVLGYPVEFARLREILMRNRSYGISFSAAYQLAHGFSKAKQYKKSLFYARIAHDRAVAAGKAEYIAKSHNEIGNCLLAESYFEEAIVEYEKALELVPDELSVFHVAIFVNLGYSKIVQGELTEGFRLLYAALRWCRRNPSENVYESWTHLALSCGFIEQKRWRYAWKHGWRGLELAESIGSPDAIKIGLYLMAEIEKSAGDVEAAYDYYSRMQREFYPGMNNLAGAMLFLETKKLVNLRA